MINMIFYVSILSFLLIFTGCSDTINKTNDTTILVNSKEINSTNKTGSLSSKMNKGEKISKTVISNNVSEDSNKKNFKNKITLLKCKMEEFNPTVNQMLPKDVNEVSRTCSEMIKDILLDEQSINCNSKDILVYDNNFHLKFGKRIDIDNKHYRLIEFGMNTFTDGGIIDIYLQVWEDKTVVQVQNVATIIQTASSQGNFIYYDFIEKDENYYFNIISNIQGVENKYLILSTYKIQDSKLIKFDISDEVKEIQAWKIKNIEGSGKYNISYNNCDGYSCKSDEGIIEINALDNNKNTLSTLKFTLSGEKISFEEIVYENIDKYLLKSYDYIYPIKQNGKYGYIR